MKGGPCLMALTPMHSVRIEPELESAARSHPGLADVSPSTLVRIGLAVLADLDQGVSIAGLRSRYGDRSHRRLTPYSKGAKEGG